MVFILKLKFTNWGIKNSMKVSLTTTLTNIDITTTVDCMVDGDWIKSGGF